MNQEKIGKFISTMRKKKDLTQEQLAEKLNVSKNAVSKWERGLNLPDASIMQDVCSILDISLNELFAGEKLNKDEQIKHSEQTIINILKNQKHRNKIYKILEERKKNGWSQEELANQLGVSRQAVSKWESAGAVPDLQRILQMSELFGVSTDYLLKDEMQAENITYHESTESYAEPLKKVTMENANEFLDMKRNGSKVVANATSMCILSPILLIVLVTMAEDSVFHVSESLATVFGCVFLLGMVAAAVFLFITY